jgi:hypothetical protein
MRRVFRLSRPAWGGIVLLLVATGTLLGVTGHLVSGQDGLALARLLPKGALAYVQARDLGKLLAQWRASSVHDRYYASDSFRAFRRSRLWAKLNERIREFEEGVGVTLTEDTVMQMAGKATAIALYDMGKLELVFVTELSAQQAAATPLLARKATFEARTTTAGQPYLVRELATDGGRLRQGLCVATPPGKLVVATSEALMQRTLDNLDGKGDDHVLASMGPTLAAAQGFTPHDVTLWTDLPRLRQQPYFGYYWVHGAKAPGLDEVEATLADLELTSEGLVERRWSLTSGRAVPAAFTPQQQPVVARLLNASPFAVVETLPVDAGNVPAQIAVGILFPLPRPVAASDLPRIRVIEDTASSTARRGRYERLDERFDRDVDDPDALSSRPPARQAAGTRPPTRSAGVRTHQPVPVGPTGLPGLAWGNHSGRQRAVCDVRARAGAALPAAVRYKGVRGSAGTGHRAAVLRRRHHAASDLGGHVHGRRRAAYGRAARTLWSLFRQR